MSSFAKSGDSEPFEIMAKVKDSWGFGDPEGTPIRRYLEGIGGGH